MLRAEKTHCAHAIVEQVIADLKSGALAHLPSGQFASNDAWLIMAAIAFNLTRAAGTIDSVFHAKATTATIRRQLNAVPFRLTRSARRLVIHLPKNWPWHDSWEGLFNAACGPPTPTTTRPPKPRQCPTKDASRKAGQTGGYLTPSQRRPDQNRTDRPANTSSVDRGSVPPQNTRKPSMIQINRLLPESVAN